MRVMTPHNHIKDEEVKMSDYNPDNWVIIKIKGDDPHYKVLAGWSGGYTSGNSWRMNSGIVRVEKGSNSWKFYGSSGSCYECGFHNYVVRMNIAPVLNNMMERYPDQVELMPEDTDWMNFDWIIK